jgi:hypothetical protein
VTLSFRDFPIVVAAADAVGHSQLGDRHQVQCRIELPVTTSRKPVTGPLAACHLDGSDSRIARKRRRIPKPGRTTCAAQQPNSEYRANTLYLKEPGATRTECLGHPPGYLGQPGVDSANLLDEIASKILACPLGGRGRSHASEQGGRRLRRERLPGTARDEVSQESVKLVDQPDSGCREVRSALLEKGKHFGFVLGHDRRNVALRCSHTCRRGSIEDVVLASATPRELAHSGGRSRADVEHSLAASDKPLGQMPAKPARIFDGPLAFREGLGPAEQPPISRQRCFHTKRPDWGVRSRANRRGSMRVLVRIDSDDHDRSSLRCVQKTTVDMPTSGPRRDHASVESDRSRSSTRRHTPGEPTLQRRQAVHESLWPMTYGTVQAFADCVPLSPRISRRFTPSVSSATVTTGDTGPKLKWGDVARLSGREVKIEKPVEKPQETGLGPGSMVVYALVTITNTGAETIDYATSEFSLDGNSSGSTGIATLDGTIDGLPVLASRGTLSPGGSVTAAVCFGLSKGDVPVKVRLGTQFSTAIVLASWQ